MDLSENINYCSSKKTFRKAMSPMRTFWLLQVPVALAVIGFSTPTMGQEWAPAYECGDLQNPYGPYDFTNPKHRQDNLKIVEDYHFNDDVFALRRGASQEEALLGDLDYTLRAFPNHHLALDALARLHRKHGIERFPDGRYSITCWFERARRFNPNDGMVPMIFGIHLFRLGQLQKAEEPLQRATILMPQSAEAHYNLGLLYFRTAEYGLAREHAKKAYALDFPLSGLREQLVGAGEWPSGD